MPTASSRRTLLEDRWTTQRVVARFILRACYRRLNAMPAKQQVILLLSCSERKRKYMSRCFYRFDQSVVALPPSVVDKGVDFVLDLLDAHHFSIKQLIPLVDSAIAFADVINRRIGQSSNDPSTALMRCDKFEQQEALRRAGLSCGAQCVTADVEEAIAFLGTKGTVVIKPRNSSASDGVSLCRSEADVRRAFQTELGKRNLEDGQNDDLIVMEVLMGREYVVNSVSYDGVHKITDVWIGPGKLLDDEGGPAKFVYNSQKLAIETPEMREVVEYACSALDAIGLRYGAAHSEIVYIDKPYLYEVNARCAGGLPRTQQHPNQLEALTLSLCNIEGFLSLPCLPPSPAYETMVIFLRSPRPCWLSAIALTEFAALPTFLCFDQALGGLQKPYTSLRVERTVDLITCPGVVVLHGDKDAVSQDASRIRDLELIAYVDDPNASLTTCEPMSDA
eukprot:TRINITY_DN33977_c0_g1_i1.p1 TRINITY_DN33977_c0_g1~~TRINITY_DN33977_c0_g1_i1.p1  ORF type:complete len:449 (+),score=53.58 TRINITY_DN33977_c0_g1_i1:149-1495(+)